MRTRPLPIAPDNGGSLQSNHISDAIDTEVTQSPLNVLTNNPSTPRVNGTQNVVPVNKNITRGNTHSPRVEDTPVMGEPSLTNVEKNPQKQVEDVGQN